MADPGLPHNDLEAGTKSSDASTVGERRPGSEPDAVVDTTIEEPNVDYATKDFGFLPIPSSLRYDPNRSHGFGVLLQITFVSAATIGIMNPYYNQPILIELSQAFNVSYSEVSRIPTLAQAGYAVGIVFVSPVGDLVRRRPLLLLLLLLCASLSIGLATTNSLLAFEVISFFVGIVSVSPQVLIPLAADLAPAHRRGSAIAVVLSGILMGILFSRVLAGIIAQYSSWRNVFFLAVGMQYLLLGILYLLVPDTPGKNKGMTYFGLLRSMAWFIVSEPVLIQGCLISCAASAVFALFWVTLTFLLAGAPYFYDTLQIGLFSLMGMLAVATSPLLGRLVDNLVPWVSTLCATLVMIVFQAILVGAAGINIGAVIVGCFGIDCAKNWQQVSLSYAIYGIAPEARGRLNALYILSISLGQTMGTAAGTKVFIQYGWRPANALSLGWLGFCLFVLFLRGPHSSRYTWVGWDGGWDLKKKKAGASLNKREKDIEKVGKLKNGIDGEKRPTEPHSERAQA